MEQPNQQLQDYLTTMNRPIPGQSLTEDPDESTPYTSPPEFTVPQEALDYIFETITEEEAYADIMSSIAQGTSIMEVTQLLLFAGFNDGKWNPDLMLLLVEPTAYVIMGLAEKAGIDYEVSDDEDDEIFGVQMPEEKMSALQSKEIPEETTEKLSSVTSPSLMARPDTPPPSLMQRQ